ncbi:hypothetical protein Tco_0143764 [Tanacetum coccineum]
MDSASRKKKSSNIRGCVKDGDHGKGRCALEYMPLNCVKRTLILPLLSSYSCLLEAVSERLEIDANSDFMVTYNSDNDIVEVCDDLEVNEFMEFVVKSSRIVTLCIVESSVNGRLSSNSGRNMQSQLSNFIHAPHYQQMHGFSENPMYVPGFPGYPMQDPQSDSANRKLKQVVGSPKNKKPNERDLLDDEKLRPFGEKIMGSVFGKVKRLSGEDESSESDEDAETTPVANKNFKEDKFWNMPPLLKTPVLDMKKKDEHKHELTPWAEAKLAQRIAKSATWTLWTMAIIGFTLWPSVLLFIATLAAISANQFAVHVSRLGFARAFIPTSYICFVEAILQIGTNQNGLFNCPFHL